MIFNDSIQRPEKKSTKRREITFFFLNVKDLFFVENCPNFCCFVKGTHIGRRVEMIRSASSGGGGNSCVEETPAKSCGSGQSGTGRNATNAIFAFRPFMLM